MIAIPTEGEPNPTTKWVPTKAASIILALAQQRDLAQMRLDIAGNMARAMCDAPDDWELKAENGNVFFAPPTAQDTRG